MMDIKELSIGNWVNYRPGWKDEETGRIVYESGTGFPVKIEMIYFCRGEGLVQYNDGQNDGIEACDYELFPIEITPEILEKNGWVEMGGSLYSCYYKDAEFGVQLLEVIDMDDHWDLSINDDLFVIEIKHVHQLQNALTLCGINKNIGL